MISARQIEASLLDRQECVGAVGLPGQGVPTRGSARLARRAVAALAVLSLSVGVGASGVFGRPPVAAQGAKPATARLVGTIQSAAGHTVTLKLDSGAPVEVQVQDSTRLLRVEPGQKSLKDATVLRFEDLQAGDRVLVGGAASADGKSFTATSVIVMKKTDIAEQHKHEEEDWQKRGVGGLVSSVDPGTHTVTISTLGPGGVKKIAIHVSSSTVLRRYAPDSVKFADAKLGTFDEIKPGDQLRARGVKSADGSEVAAEEIVAGRFLNVAGTITSVDASAGEINVMDLVTKTPVLVKVTPESQLRKLPAMAAQMIAMRLKGSQSAGQGGQGQSGAPGSRSAGDNRPAAGPPQGAQGGRPGGPGGSPDIQQVLGRLPAETVADLQKGEAVMIVTTPKGASPAVTAITLLSGVEPILASAPSSAGSGLLSAWSLGAPAGGEGGGESQ